MVINNIKAGLRRQGIEIIIIGNGSHDIGPKELSTLKQTLIQSRETQERYLLFILAHSFVFQGLHCIDLFSDNISSECFLTRIGKTLQSQPIDIFTICCYAGHLYSVAKSLLPAGSTLTATSAFNQKTHVDYVRQFSVTLSSRTFSPFTVEKILIIYLALTNNIFYEETINAFVIRSGTEQDIFLEDIYRKRNTKTYSPLEKEAIFERLQVLTDNQISNERFQIAMRFIQKTFAPSIIRSSPNYGLILAAYYIAHLQSFEPSYSYRERSHFTFLKRPHSLARTLPKFDPAVCADQQSFRHL